MPREQRAGGQRHPDRLHGLEQSRELVVLALGRADSTPPARRPGPPHSLPAGRSQSPSSCPQAGVLGADPHAPR